MAKARIEKYNGEPAIVVDGVAYPPMTFTMVQRKKDYLKRLGENGIKIYYLENKMRWNQPGDENTPDGTTQTIEDMKLLLEAVPDAYIILRLVVNPDVKWINNHPDEQVLFNDGSKESVDCSSAGGVVDGMISFASESWRRDGKAAVLEYLNELAKTSMFEHVIGIFLCAGGTGEWYYPGNNRMHNEEKGTYADFSEPFRKEYSVYLKKKYGTEDELRRVWNRPDATFEVPIIPDMSDRWFIYEADRELVYGSKHEQIWDYTLNEDTSNLGVFLNANNFMHTADFFAALNEATANMIIYFAEFLKEYNPDLLVGAFYGYYGCADYYGASHSTGTISIINSGKVDFLAAPNVYNNREPGGVAAQREMQDSLRIRNQMFVSEDDSRTHLMLPGLELDSMGLYEIRDSINTLKREYARDLCEDIQAWWFDMTSDGVKPWYEDDSIIELFRRQQEVAKYAYSIDRTKKNEIAVIYDTESVHLVSDAVDRVVLDYYRTSDLHRIGAPIDYYFHDDMSLPQMDDYKLYIILNVYCLTDEERESICAKARRNHAIVLWMYAPGFVNYKADRIMDLKNIEKTVGMKVGMKDKVSYPYFKVEDTGHAALRYADTYRRYGYIDRPIQSNVWAEPSLLPIPYLYPGFYIEEDEELTVLGRYCLDGRIAYAMKEVDGFISAYCTTQVIRSELIASMAEFAGCHVFSHSDDVLFANENFVAVHASYTGSRRIYLKKSCNPYEVYEKRYYGNNVSYIDVDMYFGETKMWSLHGAC